MSKFAECFAEITVAEAKSKTYGEGNTYMSMNIRNGDTGLIVDCDDSVLDVTLTSNTGVVNCKSGLGIWIELSKERPDDVLFMQYMTEMGDALKSKVLDQKKSSQLFPVDYERRVSPWWEHVRDKETGEFDLSKPASFFLPIGKKTQVLLGKEPANAEDYRHSGLKLRMKFAITHMNVAQICGFIKNTYRMQVVDLFESIRTESTRETKPVSIDDEAQNKLREKLLKRKADNSDYAQNKKPNTDNNK